MTVKADDTQRCMARLALLITAAGLAIRLIGLGQHSYWFDEAREVLRALTPWPLSQSLVPRDKPGRGESRQARASPLVLVFGVPLCQSTVHESGPRMQRMGW